MQGLQQLAALDFPPEFLVAEVLRFLTQRAESVEILIGFEQAVQPLLEVSPQRPPEHLAASG